VHITNHFPAILRARRKRRHWGDDERANYIPGTDGVSKAPMGQPKRSTD
jgi:hypothetical protein